MKAFATHPEIGEIMYEESFWTGKKSLYINGTPITKIDKMTFVISKDEKNQYFNLKGSMLTGVTLTVDGQTIEISEKPKWYELLLIFLPFILNIVWGNNVFLCSIIPIVGGAIGGCISGLMACGSLVTMKKFDKAWQKVLVGLGFLVGSFLITFLLAVLIIF